MAMDNLVPRNVYDVDESGYRGRLGWIVGTFFGFFMGIACLFLTPPIIGYVLRVFLSICMGILSGVAFGWVFPRRFGKRMSSIIDRLYAEDTDITVLPPPEKELRYRLPCSWKRSENFAVGGILYIGRLGLLFAPHKMNLPSDRSVFEMGPNKSLEFSLAPQMLNGFFKLLVPRPTPLLQVVWPGGSAQLIIPAPNHVFELIRDRVRELA